MAKQSWRSVAGPRTDRRTARTTAHFSGSRRREADTLSAVAGGQKRTAFASAGWLLVGVGGVGWAAALIAQALAADDNQFNRLVGWANLLGALFAGVGLLLVVWDRRKSRRLSTAEVADALCRAVLSSEGQMRRRLLYAGSDKRTTANVTFESDHLVRYSVLTDLSSPRGIGVREGDLAGVGAFYRSTPGRLLILGEPGAGKTVLLIDLLLQMGEHRDALPKAERDAIPVPVRFSLPTWDVDVSLLEWLGESLSVNYSVTAEEAKELLSAQLILPFLDGLDEMDSPGTDRPRAEEAVRKLNEYVSGRSGSPMVVTCRTADAAALRTQLTDAVTITISPVSSSQIREYIQAELSSRQDQNARDAWSALMARPDAASILAALDTPWMLNLAVTRLRDDPLTPWPGRGDEAIAEEHLQQELLGGYIAARTRADHTHAYYADQVERWATSIADSLGSATNIYLNNLWRLGGNKRVRRTHAFTNLAAATLIAFMFTLGMFRYDASYMFRWINYWGSQFPQALDLYLLFSIGTALTGVWLIWKSGRDGLREKVPDPETVSLHRVRTATGRRSLLVSLVAGLGTGLILGIAVFGTVYGLAYVTDEQEIAFEVAMPIAAMTPVMGLFIGLDLGLTPSYPWGVSAHDTLISDLIRAVATTVIMCVLATLSTSMVPGIDTSTGLLLGLSSGAGAAFLLGHGQSFLRYAIGTAYAAHARNVPLRPARFLEWGCQAGIFRQTGSSYQFRHLQLREVKSPEVV